MKDVSVALVRFFGFLGFCVIGLGCFYLGNAIFNLGIDVFQGFFSLGIKGWTWLIVSIIVGFFGMAFGLKIGLSIKIRSEKVDHAISVIWHYLVNGLILWFVIWIMYLTKKMGKVGSKEFLEEFGHAQFAFHLTSAGVIISLLMAGYLLLSSESDVVNKSKMSSTFFVSIIFAMVISHAFLHSLGVDSYAWIGIGITFPVILIPFSAFMLERDKFEKMKMQEKGGY